MVRPSCRSATSWRALRRVIAGWLFVTVAVPAIARGQADSSFRGGWEEVAVTGGAAWSEHDSYVSTPSLGFRLGGAFLVARHMALRLDAQGAKTFAAPQRCIDFYYGQASPTCAAAMGAIWGGTLGAGYLVSDASGAPETFISIAPGIFNVDGSWSGTGGVAFGLRATVEHRLRKLPSGAPVFGIGVRGILNLHHDTILEIPVELGGWSW